MIYAIQAGENGPIKFGRAKDPLERLRALQTSNPNELVLLACEDSADDEDAEKRLHERCAQYRLRGEWFAPVGDVLDIVAQMGRGVAEAQILLDEAKKALEWQRAADARRVLTLVYLCMKRIVELEDGKPVQ